MTTVLPARQPIRTPSASAVPAALARRSRSGFGIHKRALTLVELLIVIIVIGILVSSILVASAGFINRGRTNNTQAVLQVVADAVEEFKREQTAKPTITRARQTKGPGEYVTYADRYGAYPPDELEVFTSGGLRGSTGTIPPSRTLAPGRAEVVVNPLKPPPWDAMRFYKDGVDPTKDALENRDQAAMIVAIETLSESASAILDRIPDKNRSAGALSADGTTPALFLDRPDPATGTLNGIWDSNDHQIRLIIDDWGMPISYLAQRDWQPASSIPSFNHNTWNRTSTEIIRLNGGQPVIFSYGPNGKDQLTPEAMGANAGAATLMGDMHPVAPGPDDQEFVIDNPFNADNVYSNPALKEKLAKGIKP